MLNSSDKDEPADNSKNRCECYKKLYMMGTPINKSQESLELSEDGGSFMTETAFQLPGILFINRKIREYPNVEENDLSVVFQQMGEVIPPLADFDVNLLSFWMLDLFIEGLSTAQNADFPHRHQKATLLWIAYFFNYFQKNPVSRKKLFSHLKEVLFLPEWNKFTSSQIKDDEYSVSVSSSVKPVASTPGRRHWLLPLPPDIDGSSSDEKTLVEESTADLVESRYTIMKSFSSFAKSVEAVNISEINVNHMNIILEILYRIFARFWVFKEIQMAFHYMPPLQKVDLPFKLNLPKPLLKPEMSLKVKGMKGSEKVSEKEVPEKEQHKNDYILPLILANEVQSRTFSNVNTSPPDSERSFPIKKKKKS